MERLEDERDFLFETLILMSRETILTLPHQVEGQRAVFAASVGGAAAKKESGEETEREVVAAVIATMTQGS